MKKLLFVFSMSMPLLLSACGFKLRGSPPLPPNLHELSIQSPSPYDQFILNLKQVLTSMGLVIVEPSDHPPLTLVVESESFSNTSYTQSSSSSTEQYIMSYIVTYHLADSKGVSIFGPKVIKLNQIYSINQNQVLSTDTVQQSIEVQLQQDAAYQIISQLGSVDAQNALNKMSGEVNKK